MRHLLSVVAIVAILAVSACREDDLVTVQSIDFVGADSVDTERLKNALATRENTSIPLIGFAVPRRTRYVFNQQRFETDLRRIEAFYADRGFPDAKVTGVDVRFNDARTKVRLTVTVAEGAPINVRALTFVGFDIIPLDRLDDLRDRAGLVAGRPRDRQVVTQSRDVALNELRDRGYPYAEVQVSEEVHETERETTVVLTAQPGPRSVFGTIEIVGDRSVSENVIRRQLTIRSGDLYRRSTVQETQQNLYAMALFQFVNIEILEPNLRDPNVKMRITVAEGRHQRVNGGVGYGTEERARVEGEYRHVNFFGDARTAGVRARFSRFDRGVRLDMRQPYFFAPKLSAGIDGQRWNTYTPAYQSVVTGARLSFVQRFSARNSVTASIWSERASSEITALGLNDPDLYADLIALGLDPTTGVQRGTVSAVALDWSHTTTDDILDPRRGFHVVARVEDAGRVLPGTFGYAAFSTDARHYAPVSGKLVVANRIQLGVIAPAGGVPTNVPFSKKLFLGGATSVRGWGRFEVGPLGGSGLPIGGNALIAASSEARLRLKGKLGGVLFVDAGNVWPNRGDISLEDLRYAAGLGLRYQTPVGPVRFDFGYQLNRIEGLQVNRRPESRRWRLHFSIGQAF
jgi:outer membrane protein assembly complex protein YaeT